MRNAQKRLALRKLNNKTNGFTPSRSKGFSLIIILLAFLAVILGFFYFYSGNKKLTQSTPTPSPVASASSSQTDETANWKTYANNLITLKLPTDRHVVEKTNGWEIYPSDYKSTDVYTEGAPEFIFVRSDELKGKTLRQIAEDDAKLDYSTVEQANVGGKTGFKEVASPMGVDSYFIANDNNKYVSISIKISADNKEKVLSSIQFPQ